MRAHRCEDAFDCHYSSTVLIEPSRVRAHRCEDAFDCHYSSTVLIEQWQYCFGCNEAEAMGNTRLLMTDVLTWRRSLVVNMSHDDKNENETHPFRTHCKPLCILLSDAGPVITCRLLAQPGSRQPGRPAPWSRRTLYRATSERRKPCPGRPPSATSHPSRPRLSSRGNNASRKTRVESGSGKSSFFFDTR